MWTAIFCVSLIVSIIGISSIISEAAVKLTSASEVDRYIGFSVLSISLFFIFTICIYRSLYDGDSTYTVLVNDGIYKLEHHFESGESHYFTLIRPSNNSVLNVMIGKQFIKDGEFNTDYVLISGGNVTSLKFQGK